jgi:hypothetical protein
VEKRTVTRRVKEIDEIKELAIMHPAYQTAKARKEMRSAQEQIHHCTAYGEADFEKRAIKTRTTFLSRYGF